MVVLWSYFHRRELPSKILPDEKRIIHSEKSSSEYDDLANFIDCYSDVNQYAVNNTNITYGIIPGAGPLLTNSFSASSQKSLRDVLWPFSLPSTQFEFDQLSEQTKKEITSIFSKNELDLWFIQNNFYRHNQLIKLSNLDYARDYHHFDKITSNFFVQEILKRFKDLVQNSVSC
jgi:hypothetical protein